MFTSGDRAGWLNAVASKIMDGGNNPPSIERLQLIVPPEIGTRENDGHVTAAAAFGEDARKDVKAGWHVIIREMITLLREQGFVGGNDHALTWIKPLDGEWKVTMPDGRQLTVFGQRERRMTRDRTVVGERSENGGERVGVPSLFETGRMRPIELQVIGARGAIKQQSFELHPFALAIPPMTEAERETLRASIERDGVKVPIVIYQKKILDGRNRSYFASVFKKPVRIEEFTGTEDEARRHVLILNIHRRHLNGVQLAILAEEFYGARADKMAAEALQKGRIKGNVNRSPSVPKSAQTAASEQGPKRDEIVANLAKADGLTTTRYAVSAVQPLMDAPQTLARAKAGEFHKMPQAHVAALIEKNIPIPTVIPEIKPKTVNERLGMCIDNLNKILIDCEMQPGQALPPIISERLKQIETLVSRVRQALRDRKMIT
jgi:ParB-like chromosome segregation protein Spo0J